MFHKNLHTVRDLQFDTVSGALLIKKGNKSPMNLFFICVIIYKNKIIYMINWPSDGEFNVVC